MTRNTLFDKTAQNYDRARRQLVPNLDDFYNIVLDIIPFSRDSAIRVLDLGAGTGLLSSFIADGFPNARVTLVDIAEQMLDLARERFRHLTNRYDFLLLDYTNEPIPGEYHAIISALSIHHVTDSAKRNLFQRIYRSLFQGGIFINADQILGETPEIDKHYYRSWLRNAQEQGVFSYDLESACERMKDDKMVTLDTQMNWLNEAGFHTVNCWYKRYGFAVYSGCKW